MKRLCRRLDIPLWQAVGLLETLWLLTGRECPRGDIGKLSNEDIALGIDYRGDEEALIDTLIACGWIDKDPVERLVIHDWHDHADDAVNMRLARTKQFFVHGFSPKLSRLGGKERTSAEEFYTARAQVEVLRAQDGAQDISLCALPEPYQSPASTPPEPELEPPVSPPTNGALFETPEITATDGSVVRSIASAKNKARARKRTTEDIKKALGDRLLWWEKCWEIFPCQDGKKEGMDAFERTVNDRALAETIYRAIVKYAAKCEADPTLKVKWFQGWINGERWLDKNDPTPTPQSMTRSDISLSNVVNNLKALRPTNVRKV